MKLYFLERGKFDLFQIQRETSLDKLLRLIEEEAHCDDHPEGDFSFSELIEQGYDNPAHAYDLLIALGLALDGMRSSFTISNVRKRYRAFEKQLTKLNTWTVSAFGPDVCERYEAIAGEPMPALNASTQRLVTSNSIMSRPERRKAIRDCVFGCFVTPSCMLFLEPDQAELEDVNQFVAHINWRDQILLHYNWNLVAAMERPIKKVLNTFAKREMLMLVPEVQRSYNRATQLVDRAEQLGYNISLEECANINWKGRGDEDDFLSRHIKVN